MAEYSRRRIFILAALLAVDVSFAFSSTQVRHAQKDNRSPLKATFEYDRQAVMVHAASPIKMAPIQGAYSRLPTRGAPKRIRPTTYTRIQQSSIPVEMPRVRRFPSLTRVLTPSTRTTARRRPVTANPSKDKVTDTSTDTKTKKSSISRMDVAMFVTYFCNMAVMNLSVATVPAMAAEYLNSPQKIAAFCAGVASMVPLGGAVGKLINGFVCQRLGGRHASWLYLVALSGLSVAMSLSKSLAPIGMFLIAFEFLSSIHWTCICSMLDQEYRAKPELMARGIGILSMSSTVGALTAKTLGASLLKATNWRVVTQFGAVLSLVAAGVMYVGVPSSQAAISPETSEQALSSTATPEIQESKNSSTLDALKSILGSKLFWQIGIAHSLGYLARGSDRLLGAFLFEVSALPRHICAGLTSSVTLGFVVGLMQGSSFAKLRSVRDKMKMLKQNYRLSVLSILGLAACGLLGGGPTKLIRAPIAMASMVTVFSAVMASTVAFQFFQLANLTSSTMFSKHSAVSLSLLDAVGFFATAQVLAANTCVLSKFGWSASWGFMALIFGLGGSLMTHAIQPVLIKQAQGKMEIA